MIRTILVPTDFSETCEIALKHAAEIAKSYNGEIMLVHVINRETHSYLSKNDLGIEYIIKKLEEMASSIESSYQVEVGISAIEGSIYDIIPELTTEETIDLMIMGNKGKHGIQNLTGGHAIKLLSRSTVPAIIVQERIFGDGYKKIVVPVQNIHNIDLKIEWTAQIAKLFTSTVHLFRIRETDELINRDVDFATEEIIKGLEAQTIDYVIETADEERHFADQILEYSIENRADLILILTNANEYIPEFLFGPWDETLIYNESQIPVMCINPRKIVH